MHRMRSYAQQVSDPQLTNSEQAAQEQEHYDAPNVLGQAPACLSPAATAVSIQAVKAPTAPASGDSEAGTEQAGQGGSQAHAGGQYGTQSRRPRIALSPCRYAAQATEAVATDGRAGGGRPASPLAAGQTDQPGRPGWARWAGHPDVRREHQQR